jgi:hypothetical protein
MKSVLARGLERYRLLFVLGLAVLYLAVFSATTSNFEALQKTGGKAYPFGIFMTRDGGFFLQDFSYNMLFLRGIHERLVDRPYSMQGQVEMVRKLLPEARSGLHHAYSPVAFVLTLLLPYVSNFQAYVVYFVITVSAILMLTYFYLLPHTNHPLQIAALAVTLPSFCTLTALAVGQTAMLTTALLGSFWILLRRRSQVQHGLIGMDFALALIFWTICFKPSVAVVPFVLMIGAKSLRALFLGLGLLLATWNMLASFYGGWWTGLLDYLFLLNHYNSGHIPPFDNFGKLAFVESADEGRLSAFFRAMLAISCTTLVVLRWYRLLTLSEMFQLLVWVFLLFSPYVLRSEDWILCLLIVEGFFFKTGNWAAAMGKVFLLAVVFNMRINVGLPEYYNYPAVLALFVWLVIEIVWSKSAGQATSNGARGSGNTGALAVS